MVKQDKTKDKKPEPLKKATIIPDMDEKNPPVILFRQEDKGRESDIICRYCLKKKKPEKSVSIRKNIDFSHEK